MSDCLVLGHLSHFSLQEYDRHGIWPVPTAPQSPPRRRHSAFDEPFFTNGFEDHSFNGSSRREPPFMTPFDLFNSMFQEFSDERDRDFQGFRPSYEPPRDPFRFRSSLRASGGVSFGGNGFSRTRSSTHSSSFGNMGGNGQWVSESRMTRTVNGVTESIHERHDAIVRACSLIR